VKHLSERLDKRVDPLVDDVQQTLGAARSAVQALGTAARSVDNTAGRLGVAGDRAAALLDPDSALLQQLQRAAGAVAQSAQSLSQATSQDSTLVRHSEQALQDLSRAARALRDLAEALEQRPESLLRGREVPR
jgi:paraquat-inducible protein B